MSREHNFSIIGARLKERLLIAAWLKDLHDVEGHTQVDLYELAYRIECGEYGYED